MFTSLKIDSHERAIIIPSYTFRIYLLLSKSRKCYVEDLSSFIHQLIFSNNLSPTTYTQQLKGKLSTWTTRYVHPKTRQKSNWLVLCWKQTTTTTTKVFSYGFCVICCQLFYQYIHSIIRKKDGTSFALQISTPSINTFF
jgi:hypothetical protein